MTFEDVRKYNMYYLVRMTCFWNNLHGHKPNNVKKIKHYSKWRQNYLMIITYD